MHDSPRSVFASRVLYTVLVAYLVAQPSQAADVPLKRDGGVYTVQVNINGVITLPFVVDSGATAVALPADVVSTLIRSGTLSDVDLLDSGANYHLADGSVIKAAHVRVRNLEVGGVRVPNVTAMVAPAAGTLLLGQSFLERFESWSVDNQRAVLVLGALHYSPSKPPSVAAEKRLARITDPRDGATVPRIHHVAGFATSPNTQRHLFLVIQSTAERFGARLYPQSEIVAGLDGRWSVRSIYGTPGYAYRTYVVATDDMQSARLLADSASRERGLSGLPPNTSVVSTIITVHRE